MKSLIEKHISGFFGRTRQELRSWQLGGWGKAKRCPSRISLGACRSHDSLIQQVQSLAWLLLPLLLFAVGCSSESKGDPAKSGDSLQQKTKEYSAIAQDAAGPQPPKLSEVTPPAGCPYRDAREFWDVLYMRGHKIGYFHTQIDRVTVDGRPLVRSRLNSKLKMLRMGQPTEIKSELTSHETPDGKFVDFVGVEQRGVAPIRTEGHIDGDEIVLKISGAGKVRTVKLPWSNLDGGFCGIENSMAAQPMKPGETRILRNVVPSLNEIATVQLKAGSYEVTPLLHSTHRLLRIDQTTWSGKESLKTTIWVDQKGQMLKTVMNTITIYRVTRAEALDEKDLGKFDLTLSSLAPVDRPIVKAHQSRRIRYRISFTEGDPASALAMGTSQQVKSLGPDTVELTVLAIRPKRLEKVELLRSDRPTLDDVEPNSLVQCDDALIKEMAAKATEGKTDAWSKAVVLERYVHETIRTKNLTQAFASAAEVARSREGDCTEHAVLLAALARAVDLPARVAVGLVYFEREKEPKHVFGYHMWTEIFVDDRWIPMDAILGRGGIGAAHIKLAHNSLKDANTMGTFVPVLNVLGKIKIEVLEVE